MGSPRLPPHTPPPRGVVSWGVKTGGFTLPPINSLDISLSDNKSLALKSPVIRSSEIRLFPVRLFPIRLSGVRSTGFHPPDIRSPPIGRGRVPSPSPVSTLPLGVGTRALYSFA